MFKKTFKKKILIILAIILGVNINTFGMESKNIHTFRLVPFEEVKHLYNKEESEEIMKTYGFHSDSPLSQSPLLCIKKKLTAKEIFIKEFRPEYVDNIINIIDHLNEKDSSGDIHLQSWHTQNFSYYNKLFASEELFKIYIASKEALKNYKKQLKFFGFSQQYIASIIFKEMPLMIDFYNKYKKIFYKISKDPILKVFNLLSKFASIDSSNPSAPFSDSEKANVEDLYLRIEKMDPKLWSLISDHEFINLTQGNPSGNRFFMFYKYIGNEIIIIFSLETKRNFCLDHIKKLSYAACSLPKDIMDKIRKIKFNKVINYIEKQKYLNNPEINLYKQMIFVIKMILILDLVV